MVSISRMELLCGAMLSAGFGYRQIAHQLAISEHTAHGHVKRLRKKLAAAGHWCPDRILLEQALRTPGMWTFRPTQRRKPSVEAA